ncbi:MAG TPA: M28 family peptidase [Bryobacteraceae bacterium]|nr:M28 family peptidase [Bryobacteraceae bacterium]
MHGKKTFVTLAAGLLALGAQATEFSGAQALEYTRHAVAFGPRPPGSAALEKLRAYIVAELKPRGCQVTMDAFTARTPIGPIAMKNIVCRFPGTSGRAVAITGHYDTKLFRDFRFVGADDGGSSTGFLLEMARALQGRPRVDDVYLVWFDGEEAIGEWSAVDGLHGSRNLAARWAADGTLGRLKALINVDMIGDKELGIMKELNSSPRLTALVWDTAQRLGYNKYFLESGGATEDDHIPFLRRGVESLDLIDFDKNYWHTPNDTMDKLSAHSFGVVGTVLMKVLDRLEGQR